MSKGTANTGYYQHTTINIFMSNIVGIVVFIYYGVQSFHLIFWSMLFGTVWLNPDLGNIGKNKSITYRMWTPLVSWYWNLYVEYLPHKGRSYPPLEVKRGIGHNFFLGTAIRLMYVSPLFIILNKLVKFNINQILLMALGIWIADALHIIVDAMFHKN